MTLSKTRLRTLRALGAKKRKRAEDGSFLVEGVRLVQEAVVSDYLLEEVFYTKDMVTHPGGAHLLGLLKKKNRPLHEVSAREIDYLSDTVTGQGIVAVMKRKEFTLDTLLVEDERQSLLVAFDGVADPGNLGTMIRTCDWFGIHGVILGRNSAELFNPKVIRATMGGVFHVPVVQCVDLLPVVTRAKEHGYKIYVTDLQGDIHFDRVTYQTKSLFVFGNEAWGVSDQLKELADFRVTIRSYGAAESLNVAVACGIVLSAIHRIYDE